MRQRYRPQAKELQEWEPDTDEDEDGVEQEGTQEEQTSEQQGYPEQEEQEQVKSVTDRSGEGEFDPLLLKAVMSTLESYAREADEDEDRHPT